MKKGFTLIELLVTVSIIGIITVAGLVIYQSAGKSARDARRREDLQSIQKAMEQYFAVAEAYPATCPSGASFSVGSTVLLEPVPVDPVAGTDYTGVCATTHYCYSVELENTGAGNCGGCDCGADSCSFADGNNYYCVKHAN